MDQLSKDAAAARALGISYGKYKGLQWERVQAEIAAERKAREEARARKRAEKEAAQVKKREAAHEKKLAAGIAKAQQEDAWNKVYHGGKPKTTCCRWCGKEFPFKGNNAFCSSKCRHAKRLFDQRKYINQKRGKEPPKKEEFMEELGQ